VLELGLGAQEVFAAGATGKLAAVFSKAAYLRLPTGLVALTTWAAPPGPIHARGHFPLHRFAAGDTVTVDLSRARVWEGTALTPAALAAGAGTVLDVLAGAPASALADPVFEPRRASALQCLERGDLDGAVDLLAGLGPGLTPAGDDALAGILLVHGAHDRAAAIAAADRAKTNDIARAFLAWAARGQSIEPVHRLLAAGDRGQAAAALADLLRFGHSSGSDLAFGLQLGLRDRLQRRCEPQVSLHVRAMAVQPTWSMLSASTSRDEWRRSLEQDDVRPTSRSRLRLPFRQDRPGAPRPPVASGG
jgi:hypothetical protein